MQLIENIDGISHLINLGEGESDALRGAQRIVQRLRQRKLYKYVAEALVPQRLVDAGQWTAPSEQDIVNSYRGNGVRLDAADIVLHENKIDWSMRNANPLDHVHFFDYLVRVGGWR